ncbi:aminoacrylate peracid reductase [Pandoraea horticolens]|uniref:Aminoacrylate peracid reductase n=1 Tax=Pandoraea horticolens TaxID=2508298 RepID=A0A5E4WUL2_9BURK|nr:RidA family protein [Pandoraea horticolens]VVE26596.1 aminoacrylate peracid reductase [Pandoraea horticolens]
MAVQRFYVEKRWSDMAVHNGTVYLAGQTPDDRSQDMAGQTRQVLTHIDRLLAEASSDKSLILSCQIFISDMKYFGEMNQVWDEWVPAGNAPPRATVQALLADPAMLVEIVVVAAQRES